MTVKLIVGAAGIDKAITSIKNRGVKLDESIQLAGLSVLAHIDQHGDTTLADRLFNAMPKGARRLALAEWMILHGRISVLSKDELKALGNPDRSFKFDKLKKTDMQGAEAMQWYECKKEKAIQEAFDVQAAFQSFLHRLQSAQGKGMKIEGMDKLPEAVLAMIKPVQVPATV